MKPLLAALTGVLALAVPAAGRAQSPGGASSAAQTPPTVGRLAVLRYSAPVPASWQPQPPASRFRAAQYHVPAASGASDSEAVVFYFGPGQGGSAAANAQRWASQFTDADGQPVRPRIEPLILRGMTTTIVELNGRYARGVGMGPIGAPKPDQTLLAAVIETPEGNVIIQLHGDRATVAQHRAGFEALVKGFGVGG